MENNTENFLKNKLSIDELGLGTPDISLVNAAREKVLLRKKHPVPKDGFLTFISSYFNFEIKPYQVGFATVFIVASIFYFTTTDNKNTNGSFVSQNATNNYSISSSTVLASLTQYTNNKTATNSSTVLTSIITFVVRN